MRLRVTAESDTFVYATSQLRLGGLSPEDLLFFLLPTAITNTAGLPPLGAMFIGGFCLWLYKKVTKDQPDGFLILLVSAKSGAILRVPFVANNPGLYRFFNVIVKGTNSFWIKSGLLPSPSYCNIYER